MFLFIPEMNTINSFFFLTNVHSFKMSFPSGKVVQSLKEKAGGTRVQGQAHLDNEFKASLKKTKEKGRK